MTDATFPTPQEEPRGDDRGKVKGDHPEGTYPPTEEMLDRPIDPALRKRRADELRRAAHWPSEIGKLEGTQDEVKLAKNMYCVSRRHMSELNSRHLSCPNMY